MNQNKNKVLIFSLLGAALLAALVLVFAMPDRQVVVRSGPGGTVVNSPDSGGHNPGNIDRGNPAIRVSNNANNNSSDNDGSLPDGGEPNAQNPTGPLVNGQFVQKPDEPTTRVIAGVVVGPDGIPIAGLGEDAARASARGEYIDPNNPQAKNGKTSDGADGVDSNGTDLQGDDDDAEPNPGEVFVSGLVLRGESPVNGASLSITSEADSRTMFASTDVNGRYRFASVPPGVWTLFLQSPTSSQSRRRLTIIEGVNLPNEDYILPDLPPVTGLVVNANNGEVVPNAEVKILRAGNVIGAVSSNQEGKFEVFTLEAGIYIAEGRATGFLPGEKSFEVKEDGSQTPTVTVELPQTTRITGIVLGPNGAPVAQALVGLFGGWAFDDPYQTIGNQVTNSSGAFEFALPEDAPVSEFRVGAYREGYAAAYSASYSPSAITGETITVQLPAGGAVYGRVVGSEEETIDGAEVALKEGNVNTGAILQRFNVHNDQRTTTDASGNFRLAGLEAGAATILVSAEGYVSVEAAFTLENGTDTSAGDIVLEDEDDAKEGRIFGLIIDEQSNAMRQHNVEARHLSSGQLYNVNTDNTGGFKLDEVEEGEYVLTTGGSTLRGENYIVLHYIYPFAVAGDERQYLIFDLGQGIRVKVTDARGNPVTNFKVGVSVTQETGATGHGGIREKLWMDYGGTERTFQTASGEAVIDNLLAGVADLTIKGYTDGQGTAERNGVTIPVGGVADIGTVVLSPGGEVSGKVVASTNGASLGDVLVSAAPSSTTTPGNSLELVGFDTHTDATGTFKLRDLPAGTIDLIFSKSGWVLQRQRNITVEEQTTTPIGTVTLEPAGVLRGKVTSTDGVSLSSMHVVVGEKIVVSDFEGNYYFDTLAPGQVTIQALDPKGKHQSVSQQATLNASAETVVNIALPPK